MGRIARKYRISKPSKAAIRRTNRHRPASGLEKKVHDWLREDGIGFLTEFPVGECHADIFLPPDILVEADGCFFHACSACHPKPNKRQLAIREKDERRYAFFKSQGFKVVVLRECEINKRPRKCRDILRKLAGQCL